MLESWFDQCPYLMGPNWTSSLELGIRLANWSFAWHLLGGDKSRLFEDTDGKHFRRRWLTSVYQHCHFIAGHPSLFSSGNNHLLGEQLGLFLGSTTWPMWPESQRWQQESRAVFEREALVQNAPDGVNREQATWYHHEVADMLVLAALVGRANGQQFSEQFWARLEAMLCFLASVMDFGGNVPAFGDADDAVMVRFCPNADFCAFRSLLATGAVLFARKEFKSKAPVFDEKSRWLLGDFAEAEFTSLSTDGSRLPIHRAFPDGGYYILGSDFETPREVRVVADAGPLGYLSIAAHGHADALSFTLSAGGQLILVDPGTYAYHTAAEWRNYFRGTSAHNTVRVDGHDQSVAGGHFMWTNHAKARCEHFEPSGECQSLVASHNGYHRYSDPVTHRRRLTYAPATRTLLVEDTLCCRDRHLIETYWHLSEDCLVEMLSGHASIVNRHSTIELRWPASCKASLVRGHTSPPLGWISKQFDKRCPCWTLVMRNEVWGNWAGVTEIRVDFLWNA